MSDQPVAPPPPRRRTPGSRRLRLLLGLVLLVVLGLGGAYFLLTRSAVLKTLVLPRVEAALRARVTADTIALRPWSEVHLTAVELTPTGEPTLFRAAEIAVRYDLVSLLRGRFVLPEIRLDRPEVHLEVRRDGRSNLDPLLARPTTPVAATGAATPELDVGTVTLRGARVVWCREDPAGGRQCTTLTNLDFTLAGLKNGGTARLTLSSGLSQVNTAPQGPPDTLDARLQGELNVGLNRTLGLDLLEGNLRLEVPTATGLLEPARQLVTTLTLGLTPEELRPSRLRFERAGQVLGELRVSGPFQLPRREGRITWQIANLGRAALAMAGAPWGVEFGDTTLAGSGFVDLRQRGQRLNAGLQLEARRFAVTRANQTTPTLDLQLELRGNADLQEQTAYLDRLSLTARQDGRDLLAVTSQRALNFSWRRDEPRAAAPATVDIALRGLRLPDWRPWVPTNLLDGVVNLQATLTSAQDGRQLTLDFTNAVERLDLAAGDQIFRDLATALSGRLLLREYRNLSLEQARFEVREGPALLFRGHATASLDTWELSGNGQLNAEGELPDLLRRHPLPEVAFQRGRLRLSALLNWSRNRSAASFTALLGDLSGRVGGYALEGYSAEFELSGDLAGEKLTLRRLGLSAREGTRSGGSGELAGVLDAAAQNARFTLNLSGLNQTALRPFLPPLPGGVDLTALTLNASGELLHQAPAPPAGAPADLAAFQNLLASLAEGRGETRLRLTAAAPTLVLSNRARDRPAALNDTGLQLELARQGDRFTLGTNRVELPPTPLAPTNRLTLTGTLDLSPTNLAPAALSLRAAVLDLNPLLDFSSIFEAAPDPASAPPVETEPPPVQLPVQRLTADWQVDQMHLGTLVIRDWTARTVLDQGRLTLQPCTLKVSDAPLSTALRLDLTRPGYGYELDLDTPGLPLGPLVDAFAPDYAGQIQGDLQARIRLTGAGVTGPALQRHLAGQITLATTNLNYPIATPRVRKLLTTLATVLRLQALATSPLTLVSAQMNLGQGRIALQPLTAASDAFWARGEGEIRLAPVLTNSPIDLPIQIALREDLARQIKLTNLRPTARTNFLALPPFVKVVGTLGAPDTQFDQLRLAGLLAGSVGGAVGGTAGEATQGVGSLLQGNVPAALDTLGNLIQGRKPITPPPTNTPPATSTNVPRAGAATNAPPPATTNAPPPRPGLRDLLEGLRRRD